MHVQFDEFRSLVLDYDNAITEALDMLSFMNPPEVPKPAVTHIENPSPIVTHTYQLRARPAITGNQGTRAAPTPLRRRAQ